VQKKKRRPKALHTGKVAYPEQRAVGNLLRDISVISYRLPHLIDKVDFIKQLQKLPQYKHLTPDMLRRDVDTAFKRAIRIYQLEATIGRGEWGDVLHLTMLQRKRALIAAALKSLRTYLEEEHPELLPEHR
jgi:hypothetical protein